MDKVVHFEIPYDDKSRAFSFYQDIFGWKITDIPEMGYSMVYDAETDEDNMVTETGVINGGMFSRDDPGRSPIIVIGVQSVDETIKKVIAAGGKIILPKQRIPNGSYARIADSEGNVIGIADSSE